MLTSAEYEGRPPSRKSSKFPPPPSPPSPSPSTHTHTHTYSTAHPHAHTHMYTVSVLPTDERCLSLIDLPAAVGISRGTGARAREAAEARAHERGPEQRGETPSRKSSKFPPPPAFLPHTHAHTPLPTHSSAHTHTHICTQSLSSQLICFISLSLACLPTAVGVPRRAGAKAGEAAKARAHERGSEQ